MKKALTLTLDILAEIRNGDVKKVCELVDALKKVMDTYKRSC